MAQILHRAQSPVAPPAADTPAPARPAPPLPARGAAFGAGVLMLLALALVVGLAVRPLFPAVVVPASAPLAAFSAERALPHLRAIAREPHPVGSPANAAVRDYLLAQLAALGLQPEVQRATVFRPEDGVIAPVENVLVRLPGTAPSKAVLVVGHYDSVVGAPAAGDNGIAVAAMLETLRALRVGPPPRNDLIFLFDDGEEPGMLGARAFVEQHPWARDVGVVFDFDADTPTGPTVLLWTTPRDGWVVQEVARAFPGVPAMSLDNPAMREVGDNNQDLHVFAAAGFAGAHFNTVGGSTVYHSPRDSLATVDPRSLQDRGDVMLAVARHFGDLPIGATVADDATFYSLYGRGILRYPATWALPLALLAAVGTAASIALGLRRRWLAGRHLALGLLVVPLASVAAALAAHLAWLAILALHPESRVFAERDFYGAGVALSGLYALTVAVVLALWPWLGRRIGATTLAAAALTWAAALAVLLALAGSGVSTVATWPALAGSLALAAFVLVPARTGRPATWAQTAVLLLGLPVAIGFIAPVLGRTVVDNIPTGPAVPVALLLLLLGLLAPQVALAGAVGRRWLPAATALLGVGLLVVATVTAGPAANRPRPESLAYLANPAAGTAYWLTLDAAPGMWTGQILTGDRGSRTVEDLFGIAGEERILSSRATVVPLAAPELTVLGQERQGDAWLLRLRVASPRGAYRAFLLPGPGTRLLAAGVAGQAVRDLGGQQVRVDGLPAAGLDLTLQVQATGPVRLTLVDQSAGFPDLAGLGLPARPATTRPLSAPEWVQGDPTLVRTTITLTP